MPGEKSWTAPADVRRHVLRRWERGTLLVTEQFPLRVPLRGPSSKELLHRFEEAKRWIAELREMPHVRVQMEPIRHPVLGPNEVPAEVWIDSLEDAVRLIGKDEEAGRFGELSGLTRARAPRLLRWLERNPPPGIYVRQMDVPGVHTKLVEAHRGVLSALLDEMEIPSLDVPGFEGKYGFLERPTRIRLRILDTRRSLLPGRSIQDVKLDVATLAALDPGGARRVLHRE